MNVSEIYLGTKDFAKIFSIIEKTLTEEPNTQIFVDDKIYNELHKNGLNYKVYHHNYSQKGNYGEFDGCSFTLEEWLSLHEEQYFSKKIASASFVSNCKGYKQVVRFNSKQIEGYLNFIAGFKQLLLILAK